MLYLHEIDVAETHRKQGIATKLMNEIKEIKDKNGYDKIFLVTNKSNEAAISLYESMGGSLTQMMILYSLSSEI